ncbi:MAG TPA: 4-hydroxyphenylpyruvate dioxygenase [Polyangiaceae bacterium]|nr:4-hydroxyphenylpyruvate dioxygenase [Polyangiaceae bacterium]
MNEPAPKTLPESLGILRLLGVHYYVRDLERSRRFYTDLMGFAEVGRGSAEIERDGRQRSLVFQAGEISVTCSSPLGAGGRAHRYLSKHPDGIGTLAFEVEDIRRTFSLLEERGGTAITDVQSFPHEGGHIETFSITTPFGDTTFRFIERHGTTGLFPGMERHRFPTGGRNELGLTAVDHVTSNFQTMQPAILWLAHVLGFEPFWEVSFHTRDVAKYEIREGSGLRSKVMWDPRSGIKFANNEPYRPAFKQSQINAFHEEHRGDGVQHLALATTDILGSVRLLRERGVELMPTPRSYYDLLPKRLGALGISSLDEDIETLADLGILVDGSGPGAYLLQIFLKDSAGLYGSPEAGPFFFEIIQRKGDQGFGAGNFRALFESIERDQAARPGA